MNTATIHGVTLAPTVDAAPVVHTRVAHPAPTPPARPTTPPDAEFALKPPMRIDTSQFGPWLLSRVVAPLTGMVVLLLLWTAIAQHNTNFPSPAVTGQAALALFAEPFYDNGPNDMGIGWNLLYSLERVGLGFGLAALVGIPLGFIVGRFAFMHHALNPLISLLRPVSPLAWLPIGLLVFQSANPASIWTIFICSIWPMILNTAQGVRSVPQDYLNVARVLNLSEMKIATHILLPAVLPNILTGVRLAIGTAWLVIVAAEMLTGGVGIGFWVWDEWNNLKVEHILIAIVVIGVVGLLLEQSLLWVARRVTHGDPTAG